MSTAAGRLSAALRRSIRKKRGGTNGNDFRESEFRIPRGLRCCALPHGVAQLWASDSLLPSIAQYYRPDLLCHELRISKQNKSLQRNCEKSPGNNRTKRNSSLTEAIAETHE
jgi:hypothetical protein